LLAEEVRNKGKVGIRAGVTPSSSQRLSRDTSFERLYRRHRRDVYGAVLRDVRDPDEAEDVTQIAFLNAFRAMRRGEVPDKPRAWLVTIAKNVVRRRYRALSTRPQEVVLDPEAAPDLVDLDGPTAGEIAAAIRRLPPNQRAVILLREIQGHSYAAIADELDLSLPAVETLIFRARANLSEELRLADHVPSTRARLAGRLRSLFPLPGLGKLSYGFSLGRAGMAAVAGGVAIMTVPVGDVAADPPQPPAVQRAASPAERLSPSSSPTSEAPAVGAEPTRKVRHANKDKAKDDSSASSSATELDVAGAQSTLQTLLPSVEDPVPLPSVTVPDLSVETTPLPTTTVPTITLPDLDVGG
jgi:RNA polymerase sigma-70 factor (ECF subfamily)